jgi:hypothetical protein
MNLERPLIFFSTSLEVNVFDRYGFMSETDNTHGLGLSESRIRIDVLRRREVKWLQMIKNWDTFMMEHYTKVKERCRKGIPASLRGQAW